MTQICIKVTLFPHDWIQFSVSFFPLGAKSSILPLQGNSRSASLEFDLFQEITQWIHCLNVITWKCVLLYWGIFPTPRASPPPFPEWPQEAGVAYEPSRRQGWRLSHARSSVSSPGWSSMTWLLVADLFPHSVLSGCHCPTWPFRVDWHVLLRPLLLVLVLPHRSSACAPWLSPFQLSLTCWLSSLLYLPLGQVDAQPHLCPASILGKLLYLL